MSVDIGTFWICLQWGFALEHASFCIWYIIFVYMAILQSLFFSALVCCISSGSERQSAVWAAVFFSQLVWLLIPLMIHWVYNRWKSMPALRVISWMDMDVFVIHNNWCIKWLSWIHGKTPLRACICACITFKCILAQGFVEVQELLSKGCSHFAYSDIL